MSWIIQNFGLAVLLSLSIFLVSVIFGLLRISSIRIYVLLAPLLLLIANTHVPKASLEDSLVIRKVQSFLYLYTNFNFYTLPVLVCLSASLFIVFRILLKALSTQGQVLVEMPSLVAALAMPPVALVYYNFGHLWGLSPLLFLGVLHYWKQNPEIILRLRWFRQVLVAYSILVALIAVPQIYANLGKPTFAYSSPGLFGMRGQNNQQVLEVQNAIYSLSRLPKESEVFFLCGDAFFSTIGGRYLSDNPFYSDSMTRFDKRSPEYRVPAYGTNFVVYCPGGNTIPIGELPGNWVLSDISDKQRLAKLQVYERK